jgi:2-keto-4-pentenoate hydratase/2-oxohepta-3-ene-1,7-dioic acid hydratase in catechol pathway
LLPRHLPSDDVRYEGELAVVIGRRCKNVPRDRAFDYVFAYTCANDLTARDWQGRCGGQWWRAKSFDTFAPLGPCLVGLDEIADPSALKIRTTSNGTLVQDGSTADMIFDVPALIEFLSGETTLLPGTVILTGTPPFSAAMPASSASLKPGDVIAVEITGIGTLTNSVAAEDWYSPPTGGAAGRISQEP